MEICWGEKKMFLLYFFKESEKTTERERKRLKKATDVDFW